MLETERKIVFMNQKINPHLIFDIVSKFDKQFLRKNDFEFFFSQNKFYLEEEDVKYLLHRFDYDQDGRISYHEFLNHFNSKEF